MSVLAVFDVRGIQEFIFCTNKIKEIIGASEIIKNILSDCFTEACDDVFGENNTKEVDLKWKSKNNVFDFERSNLKVEIIYEGGGNLYAAFKNQYDYKLVYRRMNEKILDKTYRLSVSSACVKCDENYEEDIDKLMENLNIAKQKNPPLTIPRGIAVTKRDTNTGLPLVEKNIYKSDVSDDELVSTETNLKLKAYKNYLEENNKTNDDINYMLDLDEMVTDKGTESLLAIVHIDGNNMAHAITENMKAQKNYNEAVPKIRKLSQIITRAFTVEAYNEMPKALQTAICANGDWEKLDINKDSETPKLPMRPIICAGDDITFICNARIAIPLTKLYLEKIVKCEDGEGKNMGFSACAGIAFIHSHFPFNLAYKIAEECCSNAKVEAKSVPSDKKRGFIDFHFCFSGVTGDLESMREHQYINENGYNLLRRPWQVTGNEIDSLKDIKMLEEFAEYYSTGKTPNEKNENSFEENLNINCENSEKPNIDKNTENLDDSNQNKPLKAWTNSRVIEFRNLHFSSEEALSDAIKQFKSRGYELPKYQKYLNEDIDKETDKEQIKLFYKDNRSKNEKSLKAIYYDSLEISDIYSSIDDFAVNFVKHKLDAQKEKEEKLI